MAHRVSEEEKKYPTIIIKYSSYLKHWARPQKLFEKAQWTLQKLVMCPNIYINLYSVPKSRRQNLLLENIKKKISYKLYHTENSKNREHTVYIQMRRLIMNHLIWIYAVCKFNYFCFSCFMDYIWYMGSLCGLPVSTHRRITLLWRHYGVVFMLCACWTHSV